MKILIATDSSKFNEYFSLKFVSEGVEPYKTIDVDELKPLIEEKAIDLVLIDLDSHNYNAYDTIKDLKTNFNIVRIILLTAKTGLEFAKRTMELGVFGIVNKLDDIETQFRNILELVENVKDKQQEKRKHMRVQPATYQHNSIVVRIPGLSDAYKGIVKDISLGGVASEMDCEIPDSLFFKGKEVAIDVELGFINIQSNATVILKKGHDLALLYKDIRDNQKKKISEYIISRLS